jgi:hypothetical protein
MNGKFVMEVTVPQLQHPLLYERLSACRTARERAAVFRALAEAQLRGDSYATSHTQRLQESPRSQPAASQPPPASDVPSRSAPSSATRSTNIRGVSQASEFDAVRVEDSDVSGNVFGSYLQDFSFS